MKVILLNEFSIPNIPDQKKFECWINALFNTLKTEASEITIAIVDPETSATLNKQFRGKTGPTNVLSFTYDAFSSESLGDLAICASMIKAEADEQQKPLESHWAHLTIHGVLHLLGYDHSADVDAEKMEALEIKILNELGFEDPY